MDDHRYGTLLGLLLSLLTGCEPTHKGESPSTAERMDSTSPSTASQMDSTRDVHTVAPDVATAQDPGCTEAGACFAFVDSTGGYLIAPRTRAPSDASFFAALPDGALVPLRSLGHQEGTSDGNGRRDTQSDFGNLDGALFAVTESRLVPNGTYLVVSSRFLSAHGPIPLRRIDTTEFDDALQVRVNGRRGRLLDGSWRRYRVDTAGEIGLALFRRTGADALASLVLSWNGKLLFRDYPGNTSDSLSVWRIDDEGIFVHASISCIAAFRSPTGIVLATTWAGAEGESSELLRDSSDRLVPFLDAYRYWSPP